MLAFILAGLCADLSFGQDPSRSELFLVGGPLWSDVAATGSIDHSSIMAWSFGGGYRNTIDERLSISFGLMFEEKGKQVRDPYLPDGVIGDLVPQTIPITYTFSYFSIPVLVRYASRKGFYPIAEAGLSPSWLLKAEYDKPIVSIEPNGDWNVIGRGTVNTTAFYHPFDLVGIAGMGLGWRFSERLGVEVTGRYSHGLLSIRYAADDPPYKMFNRSFSILFGMRFNLNR